jgi:hypothetical protein
MQIVNALKAVIVANAVNFVNVEKQGQPRGHTFPDFAKLIREARDPYGFSR